MGTKRSDHPTPASGRRTAESCPTRSRQIPIGRPLDPTERRLTALSHAIAAKSAAAGAPVRAAGIHPLPDGMQLRYVQGCPWLLCQVLEDPVFIREGSLPMPKQEHRQLRTLLAAGLDFPTVFLAHQLEPATSDPDPVRILATAGRRVTPAQASALVPAVKPHPSATRTARRLDRAAQAIGRASVSAGRALAGAALAVGALDPIVFGAVTAEGDRHEAGTAAAWFVLGEWQW